MNRGGAEPEIYLNLIPRLCDIAAVTATGTTHFFTSSEPISIGDFSGHAWFGSLEFTPVVGGSLAAISFNFSHNPDPISIGGLQVGVSGGVGLNIGLLIVFESKGEPVVGTPIVPA